LPDSLDPAFRQALDAHIETEPLCTALSPMISVTCAWKCNDCTIYCLCTNHSAV